MEVRFYLVKDEFAQGLDVGTKGEDLAPRRHDGVRADVIINFNGYFRMKRFRQRLHFRKRPDIGPPYHLRIPHIIRRKNDSRSINKISLRIFDPRVFHLSGKVPRVRNNPLEGRCRSRFRGTEIDLIIHGPRTAREIPWKGAQAHLSRARGLAHAYTPQAP